MIRLAEDIKNLRDLCGDSPFGCQILSAAEAYGLQMPFAQFWLVRTTDGERPQDRSHTLLGTEGKNCVGRVPADSPGRSPQSHGPVFGKLDGVMRICGTITDAEEARVFLNAVGAQSVVCSAENAEKLDLHVTERGMIMYKDLPVSEHPAPQREEVPIRKIYDVLDACGMVGAFEPFYLDLSHRVRHGTAVCCSEVSDSGKDTGATRMEEAPEIQGAAVAVFGEGCSLLTAVAVRPEYQRKGLGTKIVQQMEQKLSGRVYLLRAENENERFYASLGYEPCGAWCAGTLE